MGRTIRKVQWREEKRANRLGRREAGQRWVCCWLLPQSRPWGFAFKVRDIN